MGPQCIDVGVGNGMRSRRELAGECECGLLLRRETPPVGVERQQARFSHPRSGELRLLVPKAILAVVDTRNDPEELDGELIVECERRIGLPSEAARPQFGRQVVAAHQAVVDDSQRAGILGRACLRRRQWDSRRAGLE